MSFLVAIEGADGAGKNTAAWNVASALNAAGISSTVLSFPRYADTAGGNALGEFLSGRMQASITPSSLAVLYALDRFESKKVIQDLAARHDVVLFDRYIASNVAYQGAKVPVLERHGLMDWIVDLETRTFGLQVPDLNIYLDTPLATASSLMLLKKTRSYTQQTFDQHEADRQLQEDVRHVYALMAMHNLVGPWAVVKTVKEGHLSAPRTIADEIVEQITQRLGSHEVSNCRMAVRA